MRTRHDTRRGSSPVERPRRAGIALGGLALVCGAILLFTALGNDRTPMAEAPTVWQPTARHAPRTPAETAAWRAAAHARVEAARREGGAARARGDYPLAARRFEEGFDAAQEVLAETDEDGDAELDTAVMLIELADLGRQRGDTEEMIRRRRGADVLLKLAKAFGAKDRALLDETIARSIAMGGAAP